MGQPLRENGGKSDSIGTTHGEVAGRRDNHSLTIYELIFSSNGTELGRVQDDLYPEGQAGILFDGYTAGSFTKFSLKHMK